MTDILNGPAADPVLLAVVQAFGEARVTRQVEAFDPVVGGPGVVDQLVGMSADAFVEALDRRGWRIVPAV